MTMTVHLSELSTAITVCALLSCTERARARRCASVSDDSDYSPAVIMTDRPPRRQPDMANKPG